ncbi:hypothetical protein ACLBYD_24890 [Rhodococcus sp. C26F]
MGEGWAEASLPDARDSLNKEVYAVVEDLVKKQGWRLRKQGHAYALYCPCEDERANFITVPGTSKNPGNAAKRLKRSASRCPDRHELMK